MNPGRYNITIVQGTTFQLSPQWLVNNAAVNMTGYSADMQIRQFVDSASLLDEASTANGKIVLDPTNGIANITIPSTSTATYAAGQYTYALNYTAPNGTVYQILNGTFVVQASAVH